MFQIKSLQKYENLYKIIVSWYIALFALYSIMTRFTITNLAIDGLANSILYVSFTLSGVLLAVYEFISFGSFRKAKHNRLLILFLFVCCLSTLLNYKYDLIGNIKAITILFSQIMLFYFLAMHFDKEDFCYCLKRLLILCNFLWSLASLGSIVLYMLNLHFPLDYTEGRVIRQGFMEGRLFGFFSDPNFAAFTSLLLIYGLLYLVSKTKTKGLRILYRISIGIHICYIIMSNSRTVYISILLSALLYVLLQRKRKDSVLSAASIAKTIIITILILAVGYLTIFASLRGLGYLITPNRGVEDEFIREDVNLENISNNRSTIWKNYLKLYTKKPLFGTSPRGALLLADETEPDGYLSKRQYVTHNGYLSLLVTTGGIGFAIMVIFMLFELKKIWFFLHSDRLPDDLFIFFITTLLATMTFTFFFTDLFFTNNIETMLFLIALSYMNKITISTKSEKTAS